MTPIKSKQTVNILKKYFSTRPEITVAYLFGLCARNQTQPLSDIDIVVLINERIAKERILRYQAELTADVMAVLKSKQVDVICLNSAPPLLSHRVIRDGSVVYSKDEKARISFEVHSAQRYIDNKPLREIQNTYFRRRALV